MADVRGDAGTPVRQDIQAGRDAFVAGRDLAVNYFIYNRTWTDGVAPPPLVAGSGKISAPYRGLSPFGERDKGLFFGRERAVVQVLDLLSERVAGPSVAVVSGVSGAGKSSLLRAGVLPRLRRDGLACERSAASWQCLVLTPTGAPLEELADGVATMLRTPASVWRRELAADPASFAAVARQAARSGTDEGYLDVSDGGEMRQRRLLLIVDQCERLFTQCGEADRHAFLTALCAASAAGRGDDEFPAAMVVLSIRADYEARLAEYRPQELPELGQAVQDRYLLRAMNERELRMAITEPAARAGSFVDEDLVQVLLGEMRTSPSPGGRAGTAIGAGALPLLSHALDQAWRSRTGEALTLADYERTGGIEGAVAASAQRAYERLTPGQQAAARPVFIRLTAISPDGADTADRATRTELTEGKTLAGAADVEAVLEAFAAERLLTLAADSVEISHEVLLTAWPLLHDTWLAETHTDRIVRTRLRSTAAEWERHGRDASYLYSGSLLQAAEDTAARVSADPGRHAPLGQAEHDFLRAAIHARQRRARRLQGLIALLSAMVLGLATATALAFVARQQAVSAQHDAISERDSAVSGELASRSEALQGSDPALARLLSLAAWRISPTAEARYAMLAAAALPEAGILTGHAGQVYSVAFSPDGKTVASANDDGTVRLWDATTSRTIRVLRGQPSQVWAVAFSPDGKILASGNGDTVSLWNVATGRTIRVLTGHTYLVLSLAFSPDGKTLASGSGDGTARLWDVTTGRAIGVLDGHAGPDFSVAFSPDGKILASADGHTARLWNVTTSRRIRVLTGYTAYVSSVAFSPDGKTLAIGSDDGTVSLCDVATGATTNPFTSQQGPVTSVAYSPDGKTLVSGGNDGTVSLWDAATGSAVGVLSGHTGPVNSVAFSPGGKTLASGSQDGTVRLWDVATGQPIRFLADDVPVNSVTFSPDGKTLASGGNGNTVEVWDVMTGRGIAVLDDPANQVFSVAFSPDGKTLASGDYDGTVTLWNVATRRTTRVFKGGPLQVYSVASSPDGKTLASGSQDATIRLWNIATGRTVRVLTGANYPVYAVAFSPDGKILASGSGDGIVRLWDVATGRTVRVLTGHTGQVNSVAFSPDGKILASGSADATVRLWDVATGRPIGSPLTGHTGAVSSVAFSPDGKTLASGSADDTIRLWDIATYRSIAVLTGYTDVVNSVAFSPDGKTLAGGSADDTIRLWDVAYTGDPAAYLCAAGQTLSRAEWTQLITLAPYQDVCP